MTLPLPEMTHRRLLKALVPVVWGGVILVLSLAPSLPGSSNLPGLDKLLHAGAYALLAFLAALAFADSIKFRNIAGIMAFITTVVFGASLEVFQDFMQFGRTAEWGDLIADAIGALLAWVIFRLATMFSWLGNHTEDGEHG